MAKNNKTRARLTETSIESKSTSSVTSDFKDISNSVLQSLWKDLLVGSAKKIPEQFSGNENVSGELREGEEVKFTKKEEKIRQTSEHLEYFRQIQSADIISERRENIQIQRRVEEILVELKKLAKSSKEMEVLFKEVSTQEVPVNPGKYHVNFFEWVLNVVKNARIRLQESATWMRAFSSKKDQKKYWGMFKKHGTTFGLSGERTTATQTG